MAYNMFAYADIHYTLGVSGRQASSSVANVCGKNGKGWKHPCCSTWIVLYSSSITPKSCSSWAVKRPMREKSRKVKFLNKTIQHLFRLPPIWSQKILYLHLRATKKKKHKIIKQNNKEAKSQQQYNVVACRTVMLLPLVVEGLCVVANQQTNGYWDGQRHVAKVRYKLLSVKQQQEQPERQLQQHWPTTTSTSEENMSERTFFHEILPWGRYNFDAFTTSRVSVIIGSLCLRFHYNTPVFF